jgi:hypothetical protein
MLKSSAIGKALEKPAPKSIPLSGLRALENDFYAVYVVFPAKDWKFLVESAQIGGYSGQLWVQEQDGRECTLLKGKVTGSNSELLIEHYFQGCQFNYRTAIGFLIANATHWHQLQIVKNKLLQDVYNRKTLLRSERNELLRYLVEDTVANRMATFNPLSIGVRLHTTRWFYHPQRQEHQAHLRLLMDSLVATGDLRRNDGRYVVEPQALATLAVYEQEERRHHDSLHASRTANCLSVAVMFVGALAVAAQLFIWWMDTR